MELALFPTAEQSVLRPARAPLLRLHGHRRPLPRRRRRSHLLHHAQGGAEGQALQIIRLSFDYWKM